ncbi:MAG: D-2-hydroxyacid dehydrogenase [Ruminococcaceae bacterium]|nr:D-2-hydroxyacid dehydrogenase [Oscillospiraceae bacterium]
MNLLITGAWQDARNMIPRLREMGHAVEFLQYEKDPLPCGYAWVEGVVCNGLFLHHPIENFENLKYIQLTSAGLDRVPVDYIRARGLEIHNARGVYSVPMAEYALAGVLQLYKHMDFFRENQKKHVWEKHRGLAELAGKTVCILGCGSVGAECAKRFSAFGCRVVGVDINSEPRAYFDEMYQPRNLDGILSGADVVVLAIPLTEETRYLMDAGKFRRMKPGAILVNISRGAVADTEALTETLRTGHLGGAVLDVFEEEPLAPDSPLWELENVIITPHVSFVGEQNGKRLAECICTNIRGWKEKHNAF